VRASPKQVALASHILEGLQEDRPYPFSLSDSSNESLFPAVREIEAEESAGMKHLEYSDASRAVVVEEVNGAELGCDAKGWS
jgi:hypothetical protein